MKLAEYLESIYAGNDNTGDLPDTLELHKSMADAFAMLYAAGEVDKIEIGYTLSYEFGWGESRIRYSNRIRGSNHGINFPHIAGDKHFGNVHSHPGPSLGHIGGRAAHSPEDIRGFAHEVQKPVFIMFVAAGCSLNYAMVYRQGISHYYAETVDDTRTLSQFENTQWFDRNCPAGDRYQRAALLQGMTSARNMQDLRLAVQNASIGNKPFAPKADVLNAALINQNMPLTDAYSKYLREQTPGYGRYMEQVSIENMEWFAASMDLGFYRSQPMNASILVKQR